MRPLAPLHPQAWLFSSPTDTANTLGVAPSAPSTVTDADNWDISFLSTSPLPASTTSFVVPRWGGARVQGANLVLPINLSQGSCLAGAACTSGKFLVTKVTAHPWHTTGYGGDYTAGLTGTQPAGPLPTFTYLGEHDCVSGVPLRQTFWWWAAV